MEPFSVRPYEPGDEEAILELFNRVFTEDDPAFPKRSMETWRHRYVDNPHGYQIFVAQDGQGRLIANYSAIVADCCVRGQRRPASQPVDSVVDRKWRGSLRKNSVFVTIGKAFQAEYCTTGAPYYNEYMYGLPNDQAFGVGTRILKYRPVHCPMPRLFKQVGPQWLDQLAVRADDTQAEESGWDSLSEVGALFEQNLDSVPLGLWRDARYLGWRYRDWPDTDYRLLLARRGGRLVGATVYRLGWMGHPVVPLMDWIGAGTDAAALAALLGKAGAITAEAGGRRLETWVTPNMAHWDTLRALGLGTEATPFNLCIMVFSQDFDLEWAKSHWVLTMGDSDIY